jgi:hypothetical protein
MGVNIFNEPAGKWFTAVASSGVMLMDSVFSVVVVAAFLRPIRKTLQQENEGRGTSIQSARNRSARSNEAAYRALVQTQWTTLIGVSLTVTSSSLLYVAAILQFAVLLDTFNFTPWLNVFVFPGNGDSICNDAGLALVSGMLTLASSRNLGRSNRVTSRSSQPSGTSASVALARSQLANLCSIPVSTSFAPPQQQPRGTRLKLIAQVLQEELFQSTDDPNAAREMNEAVAAVIDNDFAPAACAYFKECVETAPPLVDKMRNEYHTVRKGHMAMYADTLRQIRQEPTYAELQKRSDKLVKDSRQRGRPQEQQSTTLSDLLQSGEAVSKRYSTPRKGIVRITEKPQRQ